MSHAFPPLSRLTAEIADLARDTLACLRFYSRVRLPVLPFETGSHAMPDFGRAVRMLPVAAAVIGCAGAAALLVADAFGLPPLLDAIAAIAVLVRVTGGLHEDGLADTVDGLGGGGDRDRKLAIMRDSRIGSYGAVALTLGLAARVAAVAALIGRVGPVGASGALVAAAAASRVAGLIPMFALPPARTDGAAQAAGRPGGEALAIAAVVAVVMALLLAAPFIGSTPTLVACCFAGGAGLYLTHLARRHLGGQTGDIAGAAQQLAEIAFLAALLLKMPIG